MKQPIDDPRRAFLVRALTMGLIAGPTFSAVMRDALARGDIPSQMPPGRSIYKLEGSVTVDGRRATLETLIGPNSRVATGANSRVIFVVASDAFILRSNSEIEMGSSDGLLIEGLRMLSGRLLSVFAQREKPHTITSSTATIGIRGTGIYVESDPERSYVCTCYGTTRIAASADPDVTLDVVSEHHDYPVYVLPRAAGNNLIVPGPFINHTDTELALIEELVGRTTPFAFNSGGYEIPRKRSY